MSNPCTLGQNWQNWTKLITTSTDQILTYDMSILGFLGPRNPFLYSKLSIFECTVQYCTVQYGKSTVFTKLLNTGMLYVYHMDFGAKKLISGHEVTPLFINCTVLYIFVP